MIEIEVATLPIYCGPWPAGDDPYSESGLRAMGERHVPLMAQRVRERGVSQGDSFLMWCQRNPFTNAPEYGLWVVLSSSSNHTPELAFAAMARGRAAAICGWGTLSPEQARATNRPEIEHAQLAITGPHHAFGWSAPLRKTPFGWTVLDWKMANLSDRETIPWKEHIHDRLPLTVPPLGWGKQVRGTA